MVRLATSSFQPTQWINIPSYLITFDASADVTVQLTIYVPGVVDKSEVEEMLTHCAAWDVVWQTGLQSAKA